MPLDEATFATWPRRARAVALSSLALAYGFAATVAHVAAHGGHGAHQQHGQPEAQPPTTRRLVDYSVPATLMTRDDGLLVDIAAELRSAQPTFLNFIYTSCTSVCPLMSQTFASLQDELGPLAEGVKMISITIDPEHDTPERLAEYARSLGAGSHWRFYTGSADASAKLQKSFGSYTPDKMSHGVATFFRGAPGKPWLRIDGFVSPGELATLASRRK